MNITAFELAQRFVGVREIAGTASDSQILAMLRLDGDWPEDDSVPWCSAFVNYIAWLLRLPRSKSLRARSWLRVGVPVLVEHAQRGFDVVVLKRGEGTQPGPSVLRAPGHVGFYAGHDGGRIMVLGGNQDDAVSMRSFSGADVLGTRRLA